MKKEHWMHKKFRENILAASFSKKWEEAIKEWSLEIVAGYRTDFNETCDVCNSKLKHYVAIRNTLNQNWLFIGKTCYDKLIVAISGNGEIYSPLPKRKEAVKKAKKRV